MIKTVIDKDAPWGPRIVSEIIMISNCQSPHLQRFFSSESERNEGGSVALGLSKQTLVLGGVALYCGRLTEWRSTDQLIAVFMPLSQLLIYLLAIPLDGYCSCTVPVDGGAVVHTDCLPVLGLLRRR